MHIFFILLGMVILAWVLTTIFFQEVFHELELSFTDDFYSKIKYVTRSDNKVTVIFNDKKELNIFESKNTKKVDRYFNEFNKRFKNWLEQNKKSENISYGESKDSTIKFSWVLNLII